MTEDDFYVIQEFRTQDSQRSKVKEVVGVSYFDTLHQKSFPVLDEPTIPFSLLSILSAIPR